MQRRDSYFGTNTFWQELFDSIENSWLLHGYLGGNSFSADILKKCSDGRMYVLFDSRRRQSFPYWISSKPRSECSLLVMWLNCIKFQYRISFPINKGNPPTVEIPLKLQYQKHFANLHLPYLPSHNHPTPPLSLPSFHMHQVGNKHHHDSLTLLTMDLDRLHVPETPNLRGENWRLLFWDKCGPGVVVVVVVGNCCCCCCCWCWLFIKNKKKGFQCCLTSERKIPLHGDLKPTQFLES